MFLKDFRIWENQGMKMRIGFWEIKYLRNCGKCRKRTSACRDDGEWRVKQERENGFVSKNSTSNDVDGGCGREKW